MSTYSNQLQPALQNLLQRVVRFFHSSSSCLTHISADVCGRWKSFIKPVMRQNISSCSVLSSEIVMHDDAFNGRRSENNIKCVVHDDLGWKNRTIRYILPHHWLYKRFSQFHRCGTYSVLSWRPSFVLVPYVLSLLKFVTSASNFWSSPANRRTDQKNRRTDTSFYTSFNIYAIQC